MPRSVLSAYGIDGKSSVETFGSGLINNTWKVIAGGNEFILQRVKPCCFQGTDNDIANNISLVGDYLRRNHPEYKFIAPVTTPRGDEMIYISWEGYFRMFPFVAGSHSKDVVETPEQAYEAAMQFGRFTRLLHGIDIEKLRLTIPCFHDLALRYQQFLLSIEKGNKDRIRESRCVDPVAGGARRYCDKEYDQIVTNPDFILQGYPSRYKDQQCAV
mgnify:CR=1 FL=1